jgi:phosphoenolpyruvate-protein kinase (PTS system EI component)
MVTLAEEMVKVRELTERAARVVGVSQLPPLGAMIETPAAALCCDEIAACCDFLSLGTNDLTQYTMAADRENPTASYYFRDDHRAVFRLIEIVCDQAGDASVSICGELAARVSAVPRLVALGIHTLSVAPPLVPAVKEAIRNS